MTLIDQLAADHDAFVVWRDGDAAVMYRHYDSDGRRVVRHQPDNCDFHSPEAWQQADVTTRIGWIV
jgi:hypothetical protein